jgi:hypothetical protein
MFIPHYLFSISNSLEMLKKHTNENGIAIWDELVKNKVISKP